MIASYWYQVALLILVWFAGKKVNRARHSFKSGREIFFSCFLRPALLSGRYFDG